MSEEELDKSLEDRPEKYQYKQANTICTTYLANMASTERVCRGREETH